MSWEQQLLKERGIRSHIRGTRRCIMARTKIEAIKDILHQYREYAGKRVAKYKIDHYNDQLAFYRDMRDKYCKMARME